MSRSPLDTPLFRSLWIAALISNVGGWMQSVAAAWLMTSLTSSPLMVGLVQTATTLPVFVVALPAGALADIVNRRAILIVAQIWMIVAASVLVVATLAGAVTPWFLLAVTFALGWGPRSALRRGRRSSLKSCRVSSSRPPSP